jgi:hypothetical protein
MRRVVPSADVALSADESSSANSTSSANGTKRRRIPLLPIPHYKTRTPLQNLTLLQNKNDVEINFLCQKSIHTLLRNLFIGALIGHLSHVATDRYIAAIPIEIIVMPIGIDIQVIRIPSQIMSPGNKLAC